MALLLGIETASPALSIAIIDGNTPLAATEIHRGNVHDEWLPTALERLFPQAGIKPKDLDAVAVSAGPGSFTGLRIGMAEAKGLCMALNIPMLAVPTFDAMAHRAARNLYVPEPVELCTAFDARREDVYAARYRIEPGTATCIAEVEADTAENVAKSLKTGTLLLGDGAEKIVSVKPDVFVILHGLLPATHAMDVAFVGAVMLSKGNIADVAASEPLYVRAFKTTTPKSLLS